MALEKITRTTINRLRRRVQRGGDTDEIRDLIQPGLSIRLTGRRLTWYFRYSTALPGQGGRTGRTAQPVCSVDACADPDAMRMVIAAGKAALLDGRDPMAAVRTALAEVLRLPETRVRTEQSADPTLPASTTWDFVILRREFHDHPPAWLREESVKSYYRAMAPSQVDDLGRKLLVEITPADIRAVRATIEARGKARQATLTVQAIKTAFEWAAEPQQTSWSGITADTNPALEVITKRRKRRRTKAQAIEAARKVAIDAAGNIIIDDPTLPTREDLGRLVNVLTAPDQLGLLKRAVLLFLLFSAQRRFTVASALRRAVVAVRGHRCGVWVLDGGTTKAGRPHVLPFAAVAASVIEDWKATLPAGDWLFPGIPTKAKPRATGHINARTINDWLHEAWVLAGASRVYAPHRIRRAFQTYLSRQGVNLAHRKLIVDHSEGRAGDVTEEYYNLDPLFDSKLCVMEIWNRFLHECAEKAKKQVDHPLIVSARDAISPSELGGVAWSTSQINPHDEAMAAVTAVEEPLSQPLLDADREVRPIFKVASADPERVERMRKRLDERATLDRSLNQLRQNAD